MKASCWTGRNTVEVENVPDPQILNDRDAIVRITSTAICGSDLHLYDGYVPTMETGDILGHEFMGEVVEVGRGVDEPARSATGWSCRSRSPAATASPAERELLLALRELQPERLAWPRSCSATRPPGIFGYSHLLGGFAGGQAEYARVPFADVGPIKIPDDLRRRAGAVPVRHLPHRLHGRGDVRHPARRRRSPSGAAGPVGQFAIASAVPARRRAGHRHRPLPVPAARWRASGRGAETHQLRGGRRPRAR